MSLFGKVLAVLLAIGLAIGIGIVAVGRYVEARLAPAPETIVAGSLQGLREQNRLSAFAARYVAVVTSKQQRLGVLTAQKTLIMPGMVRYEVDLAKLSDRDVRWDSATKTLKVILPPIELVGPQVDLDQVREYDGGGILLALTDAGAVIDAANRKAGQAELVRQAREPMPLRLARDATRRAIERSFAMPLRAAGLDATVEARFANELDDGDRLDRSRRVEDVLGNGR